MEKNQNEWIRLTLFAIILLALSGEAAYSRYMLSKLQYTQEDINAAAKENDQRLDERTLWMQRREEVESKIQAALQSIIEEKTKDRIYRSEVVEFASALQKNNVDLVVPTFPEVEK